MPPPTPPLRAPAGFLNRALSPSRNPIPRLPNLYTSGQASSASTPSASLRSAQAPTAQQTTSAAFTRPIAQQTARMSSMPATGGHSEACCNIPPVVASGYKAQGSYEQVGGFKTYVTGPADATKAILVIFDIFGFFDQTVQGADILATSDKHQKYKVYMPDWFNGEPCPIEWFPPNTEEKQKNLGNFFKKFPPPSVAEKVPAFVKAANEHNSSIKSWGILGYCWGGKVVSLATSGDKTPFSIAAEIHPAMVDANDASSIKVPLIMLASKDEAPEDVKNFESNLTVAKHVETFGDQIHGWMAARSDLTDDHVKEEYIRGYKTVLEFFGKQWN